MPALTTRTRWIALWGLLIGLVPTLARPQSLSVLLPSQIVSGGQTPLVTIPIPDTAVGVLVEIDVVEHQRADQGTLALRLDITGIVCPVCQPWHRVARQGAIKRYPNTGNVNPWMRVRRILPSGTGRMLTGTVMSDARLRTHVRATFYEAGEWARVQDIRLDEEHP